MGRSLDIKTVGMRIVRRFRDTDTPRAVLGVHADRTAPGRGRKVGIECLHRRTINKWGLFGWGRCGLSWIGVVFRLRFAFLGQSVCSLRSSPGGICPAGIDNFPCYDGAANGVWVAVVSLSSKYLALDLVVIYGRRGFGELSTVRLACVAGAVALRAPVEILVMRKS